MNVLQPDSLINTPQAAPEVFQPPRMAETEVETNPNFNTPLNVVRPLGEHATGVLDERNSYKTEAPDLQDNTLTPEAAPIQPSAENLNSKEVVPIASNIGRAVSSQRDYVLAA